MIVSSKYRFAAVLLVALLGPALAAQQTQDFQPTVGQAGRDVVWVPTPEALVEEMLDLAEVTADDFVMDLGSGDGRNIIAAAKRGARAVGVEFNPDMVELSRRIAAREGVGERASFIEGDMFEADISKASVLALFLLPDNLARLREKFLNLRPGTRIVANTFPIPDWEPDETTRVEDDCVSWCTALLFIVPAKVAGTWRLPDGELMLEQNVQIIKGAISSNGARIAVGGRLRGDQITFTANDAVYTGRVSGDRMEGLVALGGSSSSWRAVRAGESR